MTSRRSFLRMGAAAAAMPLAARASAGRGSPESIPIYAVIYDSRFPESVAFAHRATTLGLTVRAIRGDMTAVWYDEIYHRWKQGPAAIAGLTGHGAYFCFDQLARDQRLRVAFEAEHRPASGGGVVHRLKGPEPLLADAVGRARSADRFGTAMAEVVASCPAAPAARARTHFESPRELDLDASEDALYTWVLAPPARG